MDLLPAKFGNYNIALSNTEIQIFHLSVKDHTKQLNIYENILQSEELSRASRFFKYEDKQRFVIGRGVLKHLSALYVKSTPELIVIISDQNKKPIIKDYNHLHFNVSHSKDCIVFAFSGNEIGIDVENINKDFDYQSIIKNCFTANEIQYIEKSNTPGKEFFKLWTRKEALLKATGKGLIEDINKLECLSETCVSEIAGLNFNNHRISSFGIEKDYIGGVAYNSSGKTLSFYKI